MRERDDISGQLGELRSKGGAGSFLADLSLPPRGQKDEILELVEWHLFEIVFFTNRILARRSSIRELLNEQGELFRQGVQVPAEIFDSVESVIDLCGRVCLHIWPTKPLKKKSFSIEKYETLLRLNRERSQLIQGILEINKKGIFPLLSDRTVRNSVSHRDERMDEFFIDPQRTDFITRNVGGSDRVRLSDGSENMPFFDHFNSRSWNYQVYQDVLNIQELFCELELLRDKAHKAQTLVTMRRTINARYLEMLQESENTIC
ncbi:MAG: hypothetical protein AAF763_02200 [Pseudomonadota bacterium]